MWGRTVSHFFPDSPREAPTRKVNFVEVLEKWGSVLCGNWHFTFVQRELLAVWFFTGSFPSNWKVQIPRGKGCHNEDTIQNFWHGVMPQVILQYIAEYVYCNPNELETTTQKIAAPFPGWWEFMNQNNQEKQHQFDCSSNSHTIWFFPKWTQVKPTKKQGSVYSMFLSVSSITPEKLQLQLQSLISNTNTGITPLWMTTKSQVPSFYKASQRFLFRMAPRGTAYSTQQLFERKEILTSIFAQSILCKKQVQQKHRSSWESLKWKGFERMNTNWKGVNSTVCHQVSDLCEGKCV